jgi:hypothetical protein
VTVLYLWTYKGKINVAVNLAQNVIFGNEVFWTEIIKKFLFLFLLAYHAASLHLSWAAYYHTTQIPGCDFLRISTFSTGCKDLTPGPYRAVLNSTPPILARERCFVVQGAQLDPGDLRMAPDHRNRSWCRSSACSHPYSS